MMGRTMAIAVRRVSFAKQCSGRQARSVHLQQGELSRDGAAAVFALASAACPACCIPLPLATSHSCCKGRWQGRLLCSCRLRNCR
jgi:hypothetical protein